MDATLQVIFSVCAIVANVVTVVVVLVRLGTFIGTVKAQLETMRENLTDIAAGKAPVCVIHTQQLLEHERRICQVELKGPAK